MVPWRTSLVSGLLASVTGVDEALARCGYLIAGPRPTSELWLATASGLEAQGHYLTC